MNQTTVSTSTAEAIALARFFETTIITLIPTVILAALVSVQAQRACTPSASAPCAFHWNLVFLALVSSLTSGAINSLTAFISKTHQIATTPQAVIAQTVPADGDRQDRTQRVVGDVVPVTTLSPSPIPPAT